MSTKRKGRTALSEFQIQKIITSPRACLDRILVGGGIDYADFGCLQVCYTTAHLIDKHSGMEPPNTDSIEALCKVMDAHEPVDEELVIASRSWLDEYAAFLRRVPAKAVEAASNELTKMVADHVRELDAIS